jgi:hypothetical protein
MNDRYSYQSLIRFLIRRRFIGPATTSRRTMASPAMLAKRSFAAGLLFSPYAPRFEPGGNAFFCCADLIATVMPCCRKPMSSRAFCCGAPGLHAFRITL